MGDGPSRGDHLRVAVRRAADRTTASLRGDLDLATASRLRSQLESLVAERPSQLVIDLDAVTFVDATGLAVLVGTQQQLAREGGRMTLHHPSRMLRRMILLLDLEQALPVEPAN